ncbi:MAG: aminotransferase class III-fold pyridoxal phosphate-dependent enzyme [Spirosomataceae bacterium]|jgi:acetylornithine/succinyldiaminopimelate/putrescine aminotransferase
MDNRTLFLNNLAQTSDFPLALELIYAEGSFLFDNKQKPYLDLISGISVSNVGHRHPKVVAAIKEQIDRYLHQMVFGEYIQSPQVQLAQALTETLSNLSTKDGHKIDNVYFTNSGTEAVEGALKLAKRFTGKTEIISCHNSYHGSTHGALSLGEEHFKRSFRPLLPGIRKIERNNLTEIEKINKNTAAVIIELIGAESGIRETSIEFIKSLAERCKSTGTLLIFDEIQTGFGRTGKFWACEHYGIAPDILLSAKGMGGGMPIGAFMAPHEIMKVLKNNPILGHITTFGGHPVSCAASLATLKVIHDEIIFFEMEKKALKIREIFSKIPDVSEVRRKGMMLAAQMENFDILKKNIDRLIDLGIITDWFLYCDNAMRISPPLNISWEEITWLENKIKAL